MRQHETEIKQRLFRNVPTFLHYIFSFLRMIYMMIFIFLCHFYCLFEYFPIKNVCKPWNLRSSDLFFNSSNLFSFLCPQCPLVLPFPQFRRGRPGHLQNSHRTEPALSHASQGKLSTSNSQQVLPLQVKSVKGLRTDRRTCLRRCYCFLSCRYDFASF